MPGRLEQGLKKLGHAWLRRNAPPRGASPGRAELSAISRILVVRLDDRLGNLVLLTPFLSEVRRIFPDALLSLLLAERYWALRPYLPGVDHFIAFERRELARNPLRIRALLRTIRDVRYDLAFDASDDRQTSFNHLLVTALSGARYRVGHDRGEAGRYYEATAAVKVETRHATAMHTDLLRAIGYDVARCPPTLRMAEPDPEFMRVFRARHGFDPSSPLVLIHPGGRGPKCWAPEYWAAVARHLCETEHPAVGLVWGPSDSAAAERVVALAGDAVRPIGVLPIPEFIVTAAAADVFISGDCGPMHVASAAGTPVVAVFLVSDAAKYRPCGKNDVVFDARVREFSPEDVAEAARRLLLKPHRDGSVAMETNGGAV